MQTITAATFTSVPKIDVNIGVSSAKKHPSNMLTTQQRDPYVGPGNTPSEVVYQNPLKWSFMSSRFWPVYVRIWIGYLKFPLKMSSKCIYARKNRRKSQKSVNKL